MRTLAAVDTVHTAAAICDYLGDRLDEGDEVVAVTVVPEEPDSGGSNESRGDAAPAPGSDPDRDGREALNVLGVRLVGADVETEMRRGSPVEELLAAAIDRDVDEILLGSVGGTPDADGGLGSTAKGVLADADRPVVVLPSQFD